MDDQAEEEPKVGFRILGLLLLILLSGAYCQSFHPRDTISIPGLALRTAVPVEFPLAQVRMEIAAHDSLEQSLEIFDADLPRAGIHPVWVRLRNDGTHSLTLDSAHISVIGKTGLLSQLIPPQRVVDLLYKSYRSRLYSPHFRGQLENRFEELRLKITTVSPGQEASGFLFFLMDGRDYGLLSGARLRWTDIRSSGSPDPLTVEFTFPGP